MLNIGKLARMANVNIETIRFYEREGLLEKPARKASGYRQYPPDAVKRLRFVRRAKTLGFSLKEIKELLALSHAPGTTCGQIKMRAEAKLDDIMERIRALQRMKRALKDLVDACGEKGPLRECPILDALEERSS